MARRADRHNNKMNSWTEGKTQLCVQVRSDGNMDRWIKEEKNGKLHEQRQIQQINNLSATYSYVGLLNVIGVWPTDLLQKWITDQITYGFYMYHTISS